MQNLSDTTQPATSGRVLLLGIFVLSGFAGLIYQSIWSHYLGIFLGHAAYAQALVLAIFMGGMAAGAMWIARAGECWRNLIRCYALIEGLIGILGLFFHWIFTAVLGFSYDVLMPAAGSPFMADVLRWLTAAALILPQTILLGMTFPLMSGGLIRRFPGQDGSLLGGLYFTNIVKALIKSNKGKEPKQQGIHISQPPLFPQPFDPCPCLLYRVEIRAIGRKPQHRMSLSL